jgi:hypothetical protein
MFFDARNKIMMNIIFIQSFISQISTFSASTNGNSPREGCKNRIGEYCRLVIPRRLGPLFCGFTSMARDIQPELDMETTL